MRGIELSEQYFENFGRPLLENEFSGLLPFIAVGLAGSGSECLGFDDEVSRDHDFEPGFCIFLPGEDTVSRRDAFLLEKAYAKLPKEFMGVKRERLAPVGGPRHGVIRIPDFFSKTVGSEDGELTFGMWFSLPEQALLEATSGRIFFDNFGLLTSIRERLEFFPRDVMLKKLAGRLLLMGQSGQYNYERCIKHGEPEAAQLAVFEFVDNAVSAAFLLSGKYRPYYKWAFRALREIPSFCDIIPVLNGLMTTANSSSDAERKISGIENVSRSITHCLKERGLLPDPGPSLEAQAYAVNALISDSSVRNSHILSAV